jgi:hypothetical protein
LVNQHRMGERIADFVREHHGSGEMRALQAMYHRRLSYPSSGDGASRRRLIFPTRPRRSVAS